MPAAPLQRVLAAAIAACAFAPAARAEARPGFTPPPEMARVYVEAGARFGVAPRLLAAIGYNESRHGRSRLPGVSKGVNRAGCCAGPAQICVMRSCGRVWQRYRVDGDGDGRKRVHDPDDGFATAARYVVALRRMIRSTRPRLLLAAYNAGPGIVRRSGGVPPYRETVDYVIVGKRLMRTIGASTLHEMAVRGFSLPAHGSLTAPSEDGMAIDPGGEQA